jgi:aerobic-type carbon monoxide dehydrogenase small subunit (CoxS/CutS family)
MADLHKIKVTVNGTVHEREVEARRLLGDFLREDLELHSVHFGCEHGVCGACTVHMDGVSVRSCLTFAVQTDGSAITTVESTICIRCSSPSRIITHCNAASVLPAC